MAYRLAIFDLDGTLLNTLDDLHASVSHALAAFSMPPRTRDEVRRFVGNGIRKLIERAVPAGTDAQTAEQVFSEFNRYYAVHCADNTRAYDGVDELLHSLCARGVKCAVVSNKADYAVQSLCERFFGDTVCLAVGAKDGIRKKPAPDSVLSVLDALKTARRDAVYIGDSDVDVETAKNAGIDCIAVDWGFRERELLAATGVGVIVSTAEELGNAI